VEQQIARAWRVVGADDPSGRTVGFARAVSDGVAFACLADVIVDPPAPGRGLGVALIQLMIDDGPGRDFRWTPCTRPTPRPVRAFRVHSPDATYLERRSGR